MLDNLTGSFVFTFKCVVHRYVHNLTMTESNSEVLLFPL